MQAACTSYEVYNQCTVLVRCGYTSNRPPFFVIIIIIILHSTERAANHAYQKRNGGKNCCTLVLQDALRCTCNYVSGRFEELKALQIMNNPFFVCNWQLHVQDVHMVNKIWLWNTSYMQGTRVVDSYYKNVNKTENGSITFVFVFESLYKKGGGRGVIFLTL